MFERPRSLVLRLARVPADPSPPAGAPGSARVFRASVNLFRLRLAGWAFGQLVALTGIVVSFWFLGWLKQDVADLQAENRNPVTATTPGRPAPRPPSRRFGPAERVPAPILDQLARYSFPILTVVEVLGAILFLAQLVLSYVSVRLDFELRWYIVTDRSLRIRTGLFNLQELTMSFANLQQVSVTQGPLQRLLRMADVCVQSAGGGGGDAHTGDPGTANLHTGTFHGVENASEIRDLILDRLRQFRAAGLGDPEDNRIHGELQPEPGSGQAGTRSSSPDSAETLQAARAMLAEARLLRGVLEA